MVDPFRVAVAPPRLCVQPHKPASHHRSSCPLGASARPGESPLLLIEGGDVTQPVGAKIDAAFFKKWPHKVVADATCAILIGPRAIHRTFEEAHRMCVEIQCTGIVQQQDPGRRRTRLWSHRDAGPKPTGSVEDFLAADDTWFQFSFCGHTTETVSSDGVSSFAYMRRAGEQGWAPEWEPKADRTSCTDKLDPDTQLPSAACYQRRGLACFRP